MSDLQDTTDALIEGRIGVPEARDRVRTILQAPDRWGSALTVIAFGLGSAPAAMFFGGGWREMALTAVLGTIVGLTLVLLGMKAGLARLVYPVAGTLVGFLAVAFAYRFAHVSPQILTVSGLIVLVPGLRLVVSMN